MTTKDTNAEEPVGSPVVRPVRPCGWRWLDSWIFRKSVPNYSSKYEWGPVYDQAALDAAVAEGRDCRTCRNFRGTQHCHSVLRCVDGSSYQRGGVVQLWEEAPIEPAPF